MKRLFASLAAVSVCLGLEGCHHVSSDGFFPFFLTLDPERVARFVDTNLNGVADAGDQVVLVFNGPVVVNTTDPNVFELFTDLDTFGTGATLVPGPDPTDVTIVLGTSPRLRTRARFAADFTSANSPSGIDVRAGLPAGTITDLNSRDAEPLAEPRDIVPAFVDGGELQVDPTRVARTGLLDGDGREDLVLALPGGIVQVFFGADGGGFGTPVLYDFGDEVRTLALADFNGDGSLDIFAGLEGADRVWENDGTGTFSAGLAAIGVGPTTAAVAADYDRDGNTDVAVVEAGFVVVYRNEGDDTFSTLDGPFGPGVESLAAGDFDRDGDEDLIAGASGFQVLENRTREGLGFDASMPPIGAEFGPTRALAVGDLDRDGFLDIVAGRDGANVQWRGGEGATFTNEGGFTEMVDATDTRTLAFLDVDRDGFLDLVEGLGNGARIWSNDGLGRLVDPEPLASPGALVSLALVDFDQDGDRDFVGSIDGAGPRIWRNSLAGTWGGFAYRESKNPAPNAMTLSLAVADVNRDSLLDYVAGGNNGIDVFVNTGIDEDGVPQFTAAPALSTSGARAIDVVFGDVDADGDDDLVAAVFGLGAVWFENVSGTLATTPAVLSTSTVPTSLALGDVDADGDLDLVVGVTSGEDDELHRNAGHAEDGTWLGFDPPELFPKEAEATGAVALVDVDKDGDLDFVAGYGANVDNALFTNDGEGIFEDSGLTLGVLGCRKIATGDLERDGDADLVFANNKANRLWANGTTDPANIVFEPQQDFPNANTYDVFLDDLDGDGDLDLVTGNSQAKGVQVWLYRDLGQGELGYPDEPDLELGSGWIHGLAAGDFDRDGDTDIIAGDVLSDGEIWMNR